MCRRRFIAWGGLVLEVELWLLLPRMRPWWFLFGEGWPLYFMAAVDYLRVFMWLAGFLCTRNDLITAHMYLPTQLLTRYTSTVYLPRYLVRSHPRLDLVHVTWQLKLKLNLEG